jgi:hypothetical protein
MVTHIAIVWGRFTMISGLLVLAAAFFGLLDPPTTFSLEIAGVISITAGGSAEASPSGTDAEPFYTIALGGPDAAAAVVFTRAGSTPPMPGSYSVGEGEIARGGFSGLVITGMPAHPTGVFWVKRGALTISPAGGGRLSGQFQLEAAGFLVDAPDDETREVTASGSFTARALQRDAYLVLNTTPGP